MRIGARRPMAVPRCSLVGNAPFNLMRPKSRVAPSPAFENAFINLLRIVAASLQCEYLPRTSN
jgi:hypothetical protein